MEVTPQGSGSAPLFDIKLLMAQFVAQMRFRQEVLGSRKDPIGEDLKCEMHEGQAEMKAISNGI